MLMFHIRVKTGDKDMVHQYHFAYKDQSVSDEEQAKKTILAILKTVYNQPKGCAISYRTNISGYTLQDKGIEKSETSSGCGCWLWLGVLLVVSIAVWLILF